MMFISLIAIILALVLYYIKHIYSYWKRNGFPEDENTRIPMGFLNPVAKGEKSVGTCIYDVYKRSKEPFLGVYLINRPALLIRDLDLTRQILVKNFIHFHDRGVYDGGEEDQLQSNLFTQEGKNWRNMRNKLTPMFTSGKLKSMFNSSDIVGDKLVEYINSQLPATGSKELELKNICTIYAIDIIASVIFGLEVNSFDNPKNEFKNFVENISRFSIKNIITTVTAFFIPGWYKYVKKLGLVNKAMYDLHDIVKHTIEMRGKNNMVRKDIFQLLMQLHTHGEISSDDQWTIDSKTSNGNSGNMSLESITGQAFIFYIAGQETTSATASFTIAELAMNPKVLEKAQAEVDEVYAKFNNQISYEALQEMQYLENCIQETLRLYPGLPNLNRECTKDFPIPGTDKVIKKGTPILISLLGIHHDPQHFPNAMEYIPERFSDSEQNFNSHAYMPFGEGPRICIAARMGKMNAKLAVAKILHSFNIETMERKIFDIEPQSVALIPKGGVLVRLSKR